MKNVVSLRSFSGGMNSLLHPSQIGDAQFANAENIIIRGGIPQTRPGRRLLASVKGRNVQGCCIFKPKNSTEKLILAIDGTIFVCEYPKCIPVALPGIKMSPTAKIVRFETCIKSAQGANDGSIKIVEPTAILMIQDGTTRAAYWDGSTAKHLDPTSPKLQTPIGLWMCWSASRLWVSDGTRVMVSDISDPLTFTENLYLAERSNFELPDECTGLIETANKTGLLAFTRNTVTAFKSFVRDRTKWQQTEDFQTVMVRGIGCIAGGTLINHNGSTYWLSEQGIISLDAALAGYRSSRMVPIDSEMDRHRSRTSSDASLACAAGFDNFLLFALPVGGKYNEREFLMDTAPLEEQSPNGVWGGVWSGVRPCAYAAGVLGGRDRLAFVSFDINSTGDTNIHLWEGFTNRKLDEEGPISCQLETRMISSADNVRFSFAEMDLVGVSGEVNLKVFIGGKGGAWIQVADMDLRADVGCIGSEVQPLIERGVPLRSFKPQSRTVRTEDGIPSDADGCTPENGRDASAGVDSGISMLFEWSGIMGLKEVRITTESVNTTQSTGRCEASELDMQNAVLDTGAKA